MSLRQSVFAILWRWLGVGVLFVGAYWALHMLYADVRTSRVNVLESAGWIQLPLIEPPRTLSETLPRSATKYRYAHSSVGMGGRFMAYAVDGTPADLNAFAKAEFASHWDKVGFTIESNMLSPFDLEHIKFLGDAYSVDLIWLNESLGARGTVFRGKERQPSHIPGVERRNSDGRS